MEGSLGGGGGGVGRGGREGGGGVEVKVYIEMLPSLTDFAEDVLLKPAYSSISMRNFRCTSV